MVRVPYYYIAPSILLFCFLGTYSVRDSFFDVGTCLAFGFIAIIMEKLRIPTLPLVISVILAPMLEDSLRQTISLGAGSLLLLWRRPIALMLLGAGFLAMAITVYARVRWSKAQVYLGAEGGN
jgi:putative tricarboxylic transport membrane protein